MRGGAAVLGRVFSNHRLRRVELAFAGFSLAEYAVWTAILVYAFQHGGTTTAGLIAVVQLVPAALVAPFAARLTDTRGGSFALILGYALQAVAMGGVAIAMLAGGPVVAAYALAVVAASAVTLTRPSQAKLLSSLVRTPEELTGAAAVSGWIEGTSALVAPAVAGGLLAIDGPGIVFAVFALAVTGSALAVARIGSPTSGTAGTERDDEAADGVLDGLRALRDLPSARVLVGIVTAEHLAIGALDVMVVVLAISWLHIGSPGAGYLNAVFGLGATMGGLAAIALTGARRISARLVTAGLGWAVAFALLGLKPTVATAFLLLPLAGFGQSIVDVAGRALLARVTPHEVLGRVFGMLEGLMMAGLALGSLLVPGLVAIGGLRLALAGVAALLVVAMLLPMASLRRLDAYVPPTEALARLRGHTLFSALPPAVLEGLARELASIPVHAGLAVITEGEVGDRFYLIAEGEFDVSIVGEHIRTLEPGDGFGEIALLHDVPRTASVRARTDGLLFALERQPFLDALRPAI
jgi:MFS family permease